MLHTAPLSRKYKYITQRLIYTRMTCCDVLSALDVFSSHQKKNTPHRSVHYCQSTRLFWHYYYYYYFHVFICHCRLIFSSAEALITTLVFFFCYIKSFSFFFSLCLALFSFNGLGLIASFLCVLGACMFVVMTDVANCNGV